MFNFNASVHYIDALHYKIAGAYSPVLCQLSISGGSKLLY